jgi:hypothetical protein
VYALRAPLSGGYGVGYLLVRTQTRQNSALLRPTTNDDGVLISYFKINSVVSDPSTKCLS